MLLRLNPYPIARTRRTVRRSADTVTRQCDEPLPLPGSAHCLAPLPGYALPPSAVTLTRLVVGGFGAERVTVTITRQRMLPVTHTSTLTRLFGSARHRTPLPGTMCYPYRYPVRLVTSYQHPYQVARCSALRVTVTVTRLRVLPGIRRTVRRVTVTRFGVLPIPLPGRRHGSVPIPLPGRPENGTKKKTARPVTV